MTPGKIKFIERLRGWYGNLPICLESADEIERLTAENEKLRYALARVCAKYVGDSNLVMDCARAALGESNV